MKEMINKFLIYEKQKQILTFFFFLQNWRMQRSFFWNEDINVWDSYFWVVRILWILNYFEEEINRKKMFFNKKKF